MTESTAPTALDVADDILLMSRVVARDDAALAVLYDRYAPRLNGLLVRMLGSRGEAEEVLIEMFYEVWDRAERFDGTRGSVATYLMTLARSRAIDRRRRRASRPDTDASRTRPVEAFDAVADTPASSPLGGMLFDEQAAAVRHAVSVLEPPQRQAIELAFFDGLSHNEVAIRLGRPLGTIKTWVRQGLMRLREAIGPGDDG